MSILPPWPAGDWLLTPSARAVIDPNIPSRVNSSLATRMSPPLPAPEEYVVTELSLIEIEWAVRSIEPAFASPNELAETVAYCPSSSESARITIWPPAPEAVPLTGAAFALICVRKLKVSDPSTRIAPVVMSIRPASAAPNVETEISAPCSKSKDPDRIITLPPIPAASSLPVSAAMRVGKGPFWPSMAILGASMMMLPPLVAPEAPVVS